MRCFIGINLNEYAKELNSLDLPIKDQMSKAKEYHITLIFFQDLPDEKVKKLKKRLSKSAFKKFELEGDKLIAFPNKTDPELYALGFKDRSKINELHDQIIKYAEIETKDKFDSHITLLRKERLSSNFKDSQEKYSDIKPIKLKIDSFGLYKSEPNKGMNSYTPILIFKLK